MSAAEKLKAQLEATARNDDGAALGHVLPQIVAVVEAAEKCRSEWLLYAELADALSALDEALS